MWAWLHIADRKGWSLAEAQRKVSSTEFLLWCAYYESEWHTPTKQDYYLAQIAREVNCVLRGREAGRIKPQDFVIKFSETSKKKLTKEEATRRSKAFWFGLLGKKSTDAGNVNT